VNPDEEWAQWKTWLGDDPKGPDHLWRSRRDVDLAQSVERIRRRPQSSAGARTEELDVPLVGQLELRSNHGLGNPPSGRHWQRSHLTWATHRPHMALPDCSYLLGHTLGKEGLPWKKVTPRGRLSRP
jgi:hypothetical protein